MIWAIIKTFLVLLLVNKFSWVKCQPKFHPDSPVLFQQVLFTWNQLNFVFESPEARENSTKTREFIPENNIISCIRIYGPRVFLSLPRLKYGIPATLATLDLKDVKLEDFDLSSKNQSLLDHFEEPENAPLLSPYPNWGMQKTNDCLALQSVNSIEIDQFGRLWVLDSGRVNFYTWKDSGNSKSKNPMGNYCPGKIVVFDLASNQIVKSYTFPQDVVPKETNYVYDFVIACQSIDDCWVYISDAFEARVVLYSTTQNKSWYAYHSKFKSTEVGKKMTIAGKPYKLDLNIGGLALTPKFDSLLFSPLNDYNLYAVSTKRLQEVFNVFNVNKTDLLDEDINYLGRKRSQTSRMVMTLKGRLFFSSVGESGIRVWDTMAKDKDKEEENLTDENQLLLIQNENDLQWPDSIAFDDKGYFYTVSNKMQDYLTGNLDFSEPNFKIVRGYIGLEDSKIYLNGGTTKTK